MDEYEYFIECVKQHPCLWDIKHPSNKNREVKDAAWRDVARKAKIENATLAKTKWKNLRDTHREALKKINKVKRLRLQKKMKTWKYMSTMEFLLPHMYKSERDASFLSPPDFTPSAEDAASLDRIKAKETTTVPNKKRKEAVTTDDADDKIPDDGLQKLIKELEDNREKRNAERDELRNELVSGDPLKAFFDSMYQSTKQMPECYQRLIKRNLFHSVMEAEDKIASGYGLQNAFGEDTARDPGYSMSAIDGTPSDDVINDN